MSHPECLEFTFFSKERNKDIKISNNKFVDFYAVSIHTLVIQLRLLDLCLGCVLTYKKNVITGQL